MRRPPSPRDGRRVRFSAVALVVAKLAVRPGGAADHSPAVPPPTYCTGRSTAAACSYAVATLAGVAQLEELEVFIRTFHHFEPTRALYVAGDAAVVKWVAGQSIHRSINAVDCLGAYGGGGMDKLKDKPSTAAGLDLWSARQLERVTVMRAALRAGHRGVLFLDAGTVLCNHAPEMGDEPLGLSEQHCSPTLEATYGRYSSAAVFARSEAVLDGWVNATRGSRFFEQAALEALAAVHRHFIMGPEVNVGWYQLLAQQSFDGADHLDWISFDPWRLRLLLRGRPLLSMRIGLPATGGRTVSPEATKLHNHVLPMLLKTALQPALCGAAYRHTGLPTSVFTCLPFIADDLPVAETPEQLRDASFGYTELVVSVMTYDRAESLTRLLRSLERAVYDGDRVHVVVRIDIAGPGKTPSPAVLQAVKVFNWTHGTLVAAPHATHAGLRGQWERAFVPTSDHEWSVILEDDLEVSKYYYRWLKEARSYMADRPDVGGVTLQRMSFVPATGKPAGPMPPMDGRPFLYAQVGSWGFAPTARMWRRFLPFAKHIEVQAAAGKHVPTLPKTKMERFFWNSNPKTPAEREHMWTLHFAQFQFEQQFWILSPNPPGHRTFCSNWQMPGMHYKEGKNKNTNKRDYELVTEWSIRSFGLPTLDEVQGQGSLIRSEKPLQKIDYHAKRVDRFTSP